MKAHNDFYGNHARDYVADREKDLDWVQEHRVIKRISRSIPKRSSILDIPCGTGRLFDILADDDHSVIGGDISMDMLQQAESNSLAVCDIENIPLKDKSIDYVLCLRFFHLDLPILAGERILAEFARVARNGIILHGRIENRSVIVRLADALAEIVHSRFRAPVEISKKFWRAVKLITRPTKNKVPPHLEGIGPAFSCTLPELSRVLDPKGFKVTASYGTISPISSKRIFMITSDLYAQTSLHP